MHRRRFPPSFSPPSLPRRLPLAPFPRQKPLCSNRFERGSNYFNKLFVCFFFFLNLLFLTCGCVTTAFLMCVCVSSHPLIRPLPVESSRQHPRGGAPRLPQRACKRARGGVWPEGQRSALPSDPRVGTGGLR